MLQAIKKWTGISKIAGKNFTAFQLDLVILVGLFGLRIIVLLLLTRAMYAVGGTSQIMGFSSMSIAWAVILTQSVSMAKPATAKEVIADIQSGRIVNSLLLPVSYVTLKFIEAFSLFLMRIVLFLGIGGSIGGFMLGGLPDFGINALYASILLIGGALVAYFGYFSIGLLAFFFENTDSIRWIYSKLDLLFGGNIAPIPFLPEILRNIAFWSPFPYAGYVAGLEFAKHDSSLVTRSFLIQGMWIVILVSACYIMYAQGAKKLTLNGG